MLKTSLNLTALVGRCGLRSRHGGTPSPQRGEGGGEGGSISRSFVTPSPHPSPLRGEGAGRTCGSVVPSIDTSEITSRPSSVRNAGSARLGLLVVVIVGAAALLAAPFARWQARAEQRVPGLTGIGHAPDVVQARQLLMSGIEEEMQPIDIVAGGKDLPLDEVKSNAYRINIMLAAFPHLFPPQTKPGPD